jgi:thioredoxin reductase (NADPH)
VCSSDLTDVAIIGAGPCGLFQVFELGLLDLKAVVIDSLPKVGGQCAELYPDKPIYDIPGYPIVGAQELIDRLMDQIKPFHAAFDLGAPVTEVQRQEDGAFRVVTGAGTVIHCRAVVIAGGVGAFAPVPLRIDGIEKYQDTQLFYRVRDPSQHHGKKVIVLGGGDSALDWALALYDKCDLTLIHRSTTFKAAPASVSRLRQLGEEGKLKWMAGSAVGVIEEGGRLNALKVTGIDRSEQLIAADHLLAFYGLSPKLGPIAEWGLTLNKNQIEVDTEKFETSSPGIYAVGDINWYPGKKKLILSGFHEGALAAFAIKHQLFPNEKINLQYTTTSPAMHKKLGVDTPTEVAS